MQILGVQQPAGWQGHWLAIWACLPQHGMCQSRSGSEAMSNGNLHASCIMSACPLLYGIPCSTAIASVHLSSAGSEAASGSFNTKVLQLSPFTPV